MIDLINLYKKLEPPTGNSTGGKVRFSACVIPGYKNHRLGKDLGGFPCLLISTKKSAATRRPSPIQLEHLEVLYDINCRISHDNTLEDSKFTVISCKTPDTSMQEYFLRTGNSIIELIGDSPQQNQITHAVNNLVELFRMLTESPRKSVQGLWAELFVVSISKDPKSLIRSWHRSPDDKYDFSSESQRIEIKSSTSKLRQHHFSLEQLHPQMGIDVLVASVFVERIGAGTSLVDLVEKIRVKINKEPELLLHLDQMIGMTLGNNWKSAAKDRFDSQLAKKSLKLFFSKDIPCINPELPSGISDVHFKVDLSKVKSVDKQKLNLKDGLFKAISTP